MTEQRDILVWIDDKNFQGFARGRCVKFEDLDYEFCADGYNGNWRITHWCYVEAPNASNERPASAGRSIKELGNRDSMGRIREKQRWRCNACGAVTVGTEMTAQRKAYDI